MAIHADVTTRHDVVIIGSGPTGLSMAHRLKGSGLRILVLEAGNERHDPATEADAFATAAGEASGAHSPAHLFRRRMLGGASSAWGGRCIPFDPGDFAAQPFRAGWPISHHEFENYWSDAFQFLEAGEYRCDETAFAEPLFWTKRADLVDFNGIERFSCPTNAWKRYRDDLAADPMIEIRSGMLVRAINLDAGSHSVSDIEILDQNRDESMRLSAARIVIATGGIETARLLLSSTAMDARGVGNRHDQVGRHYMTHVLADIGTLHYRPEVPAEKLDYRMTTDGIYGRSIMRLSAELREREALPNILWRPSIPSVWDSSHNNPLLSAMHIAKSMLPREYAQRLNAQGRAGIQPQSPFSDTVAHVGNLARDPLALAWFAQNWIRKRHLAKRKLPSVFLQSQTRSYPMELNAEQYPCAASRIGLSSERDRFGMRRITLNWVLDPVTEDGIHRSLAHLAASVEEAGIGTFHYAPERVSASLVAQGGHHIGTARMSKAPQDGVVDSDCKVHGIDNLYIAGSAVFPTSSSANPTLLGVALALRLADHIRNTMALETAPHALTG